MRTSPVRISVVLPVYAEKESVAEIVSALRNLIGDDLQEIIIVLAKSSPRETIRICREIADSVPLVRILVQQQNPGVGLAVREGIAAAVGTHILLMDSDGEMDVQTVPAMLAAVKRHNVDLVVGARWMSGGGVDGYDRLKYILNRGYQFIFRLLFRAPIHDLTFGFKLGRAAVLKALPWRAQFSESGCETTLRVIRAGFAVTEVPTVWRCRKEGDSTNLFRRNFRYVSMALSILFQRSQIGGSEI